MKNTSINRSRFSSSTRIASLSCFLVILLAVAAWPALRSSAMTFSNACISAFKVPASTIPQNQTSIFYLHGAGPADNPPTLLLNTTAPIATAEKFKDSTSINRNGGNPWQEVGTWPATAALTTGSLASLSDLHVWLGLKNSDDQGTYFDLRVEAYKNSTLIASGQSLCITGVTRNPTSAKEVVLGFDAFSAASFNGTSDVLKLKVLTRVGSTAAGGSCGGHNNAVGLRLYFDAVARASRFTGAIGSSSDTTPPVLTVAQPTENFITATTQISVSGTFSDQSPTTITVNGAAATVQGNNFTASAPLSEGQNSLLVIATDAAGNHTEVTRHVVRDTTSPTVAISQPGDGAFTKNALVTVTGTYSDATATTVKVNNVDATLAGNTFSATVALVEGANGLNVIAIDAAGNQGTASRNITRDTTAPTIAISQPSNGAFTKNTPITVTGTFNDATATAVTVNDIVATISGNSFSALIPLSDGSNTIRAVAVDAVQNATEATSVVTLDAAAPALLVLQPSDGTATSSAQIDVSGVVVDATTTIVTVNNIQAVLTGNSFTASVQLSEGPNALHVEATDAAGNQSEATRSVTRDNTAPTLSINAPADGLITNNHIVSVSVSSSDATTITATANGTPLDPGPGATFAGIIALPQGTNQIQFVATDAAGNQSQTLRRSVTVDDLPPVISGLDPAENTILAGLTTSVHGRVTDITATAVKVNNIVAVVDSSGFFTAENVAVAEGENRFTISATDAAGNADSVGLLLTGKDRTPPQAPLIFPVSSPTRLAFQTIEGRAEPGSSVTITGGVQPIVVGAASGTGLFVVNLDLASGINTFSASAADAEGNSSSNSNFSVTSNLGMPLPPAGQPAQINISTGDAQRGLNGMELPRPLIAIVTDRNGGPLLGVDVTFTMMHGDGHFLNGNQTAQLATDVDGRASIRYVSGNAAGVHIIRADFAGNASTPAVFMAETLEATGVTTTVSGMVADQNLRGLPNVLVRIGGQQTRTGNNGRFKVANVAAGPHQVLELIGRDQIPIPGRWPNISYDFDVLPGIDNDLGRPLFLPKVNDGVSMPLDANNVVTQDTVFELPVIGGEPPVKVTAKAGTHIIFPPDVTDKRLSVTRIATNRTPMVLEDGRATNLYISVQPSGAIFETPLEVSFPNIDGLSTGDEVLLMGFDHEAGRYVRVGTAHVSADGRAVTSDAGSGIRFGAWYGAPPARPQPLVTVLGHIQFKDNPAFENKAVINAEAWVEGVRAVAISAPNAEDRLDFRATLSLPQGGSAKLAKMESTTVAVDVRAVMEGEGRNPDGSLASIEPSSPKYALLALASSPYSVDTQSLSDSPLTLNVAAYLQPQSDPVGDIGVRYGGSMDSSSDSLLVRVRLLEGMQFLNPPKRVVWTITGPGSDAYTPPDPSAASLSWDLGKLQPDPGILKIQAVVYWAEVDYGPPYIVQGQVEIGIRSDDVVAIGWINHHGVPLAGDGVSPSVLQFYPVEGMRNTNDAQKFLTLVHLGSISLGNTNQPVPIFNPLGPPIFIPLTPLDKIYILNWMFKHAANPCEEGRCPPDSFASKSDVDAFQIARRTSYKMFNRFQITYRVAGGRFNSIPAVRERAAEVGTTVEPIYGDDAPGEAGNNNDEFSMVDNAIARLVNDGNPEPIAVRAFDTLTYPLTWNNIGSRIELGSPLGTGRRITTQVYPTYFIYDNGTKTQTNPQAQHPIGNFTRGISKPHVP